VLGSHDEVDESLSLLRFYVMLSGKYVPTSQWGRSVSTCPLFP